eukprot:351491-Chlamydomonas_euryale.AAC.38
MLNHTACWSCMLGGSLRCMCARADTHCCRVLCVLDNTRLKQLQHFVVNTLDRAAERHKNNGTREGTQVLLQHAQKCTCAYGSPCRRPHRQCRRRHDQHVAAVSRVQLHVALRDARLRANPGQQHNTARRRRRAAILAPALGCRGGLGLPMSPVHLDNMHAARRKQGLCVHDRDKPCAVAASRHMEVVCAAVRVRSVEHFLMSSVGTWRWAE